MTLELLIKVLIATIEMGTPLLFATLGSIITERSGILNLGVEGIMIFSAFIGFFVELNTGSCWLAIFFAGLAGMSMASIHGTVCLVFKGNQVVSGLALAILGVGLANYLGTPYISKQVQGFSPVFSNLDSTLSFLIGDSEILYSTAHLLFGRTALEYISILMVMFVYFFLMRTRLGLAIRATGENPQAVSAAGLSPFKLRWFGVFLGAFLIGVAGGYFSLVLNHGWTQNITAGRGWITVALVIFSYWRPKRAILGAYLFCGVEAFQTRLQSNGVFVLSNWILHMFPYILTILVLLISSWRGRSRVSPASLGINLTIGE